MRQGKFVMSSAIIMNWYMILSQELSKFPARIKKFLGIPIGNFWDDGFP